MVFRNRRVGRSVLSDREIHAAIVIEIRRSGSPLLAEDRNAAV
jgi:hypothetical protein